MCGIAGILNANDERVSPVVMRAMTDSLAHRGPDGEGVYTGACAGLGHRRLAIIDPSPAGHQPMATGDGRYVISYNGEIYNFQELRLELEALGYRFRSRTDTEVVLYAYAEWGAAALSRFNGMFALIVWNRQRRELFVARDRYGIKPLYYTRVRGALLVASEIKAFLAHPGYSVAMDREGLLEYFTFQNFFTNRTLFEGVRLFPPGSHATVAAANLEIRPQRFWDFRFCEPAEPASEDEYAEELDRLFRQAVHRQLVGDVDLGAYLSGGMDSGSITAQAASEIEYMKTFTCGFDLHSASGLELGFDEREQAEQMSYLFKSEHYEIVLKAGDMERVLPRLAWHLEEPRVGQSYPNYYVAKLASKFVKVVLAGTGGDELFGGYPWRYYRAAVNSSFEDYVDKYYGFWQRLIPNSTIHRVFAPIWGDVKHVWTRDIFRDVFADHANELSTAEDYINHSFYFEARTFLQGLLIVEDKLSMAHGLETRVPFLDNDLVDLAMRLPVRSKLANLGKIVRLNENEPGRKSQRYFRNTNDGKRLLRRVMGRYIPKVTAEQVKQGFSAPDASWFKGDSIEYVQRRLFNPGAKIYQFLARDEVLELVNQHIDGKQNRRLLIWSLLNVEQWCEEFL